MVLRDRVVAVCGCEVWGRGSTWWLGMVRVERILVRDEVRVVCDVEGWSRDSV